MISKDPILIVGFKSVGKTTLGRALAEKLQKKFFDSDEVIEIVFENTFQEKLSARDIFKKLGEIFFRNLEHLCLQQLVLSKNAVVSLGGGTPLSEDNQKLLKDHYIIHLTEEEDIVFNRILSEGVPAFFPKDNEPREAFNQLWQERKSIYAALAKVEFKNNNSLEDLIVKIKDNHDNI